jgi:hypothetical protein
MKSFSKWNRAGMFCVLVVLNAAIATAQDKSERNTSRMDVFLLFPVAHDHAPNASTTDAGVVTPGWLYGFNGGFAVNLTRSLDLVSEVSVLGGHHNVLPGGGADSTVTREYAQSSFLLAGPQFTMRRHHLLQPFARGLMGYSRRQVTPHPGYAGFAAGLGGGLDLVLLRQLAVRIIQYDFLVHTGSNGWTNYHRVSLGVVFRFGGNLESARLAVTHN